MSEGERPTVSRRTVLGGLGGAVLASAVTSAATSLAAPQHAQAQADPANTLWRLGNVDGRSDEFRARQTGVELVTVPPNWETRTTWNDVLSKGLHAGVNHEMQITYNLGSVPQFGVELHVRILHSHWGIPQMAVFSNGFMVGMIQIFGVDTIQAPRDERLYRLYIPKEFLKPNQQNTLRLKAVRSFSGADVENDATWWEWDYLQLFALTAHATEPVHGRRFHLGTLIAEPSFHYNQNVTDQVGSLLKWLGIAYSQNVMRASFWSNVSDRWDTGGPLYLQKLKNHNMRVVGNHLSWAQFETVDGSLKPEAKDSLDTYLAKYGHLIQFYEVDNEPVADIRLAWDKAIAQYFPTSAAKSDASHIQLAAPGWRFDKGVGPTKRRNVEDLCDLIGGHSYGTTYANPTLPGQTSFIQTLLAYSNELTDDGPPKPMLVTETGTTNTQTDFERFGATQPKAAIFDRILRAHVAFADRVMQHAAFFNGEYQLFDAVDWADQASLPASFNAYEFGANNPTTRVDIFRRIACAYATHGQPLTYDYLNRPDLQNRLVYTRAVDTATLPPLLGNGGTSNKVLINVVNFDSTWLEVSLQVVMPSSGSWSGDRYGGGLSYSAAHSTVQQATASTADGPAIVLNPTLAPGEAVQFILGHD
jgi:hypothetical protein